MHCSSHICWKYSYKLIASRYTHSSHNSCFIAFSRCLYLRRTKSNLGRSLTNSLVSTLKDPFSRFSYARTVMDDKAVDALAPLLRGSDGCVVIDDYDKLKEKITAMSHDGMKRLQVIADFDMTLTKFLVNGKRGHSCHSLINTRSNEVNEKRTLVHAKYYPIEIDHSIPNDVKLRYMEEWWNASHSLIIEGGLFFKDIQNSVSLANIGLREGTEELFESLQKSEVPVLIFSAGIADVIEEVLRQKLSRTFPNVRVVSNRMSFNENGQLVGFKGKLIHVLNKTEHALDIAESDSETESHGDVALKQRDNVILLGDHLGDLRMSDGVLYNNRITIGFLNDNVEKQLEAYKKAYDIVILNDKGVETAVQLVSLLRSGGVA